MKKLTKREQSFYSGVLCALAVLHTHGEDQIYRDIVQSVGQEELLIVARIEDVLDTSGLEEYGYSPKPA
jgi:hypothetical protein